MRRKKLGIIAGAVSILACAATVITLVVPSRAVDTKGLPSSNQGVVLYPDQIKAREVSPGNPIYKEVSLERNFFNGEKVLTIDDKPSLMANIMENGEKFTILEIVPYVWSSAYQVNAVPEKMDAFVKEHVKNHKEFADFVNNGINKWGDQGGFTHKFTVTTRYGTQELNNNQYHIGDNGALLKDQSGNSPYPDWTSYTLVWEDPHGKLSISDEGASEMANKNTHPFRFTFTVKNDGKYDVKVESIIPNYFLDHLLGTSDDSKMFDGYYKGTDHTYDIFREYFKDHMEVITLTPAEIQDYTYEYSLKGGAKATAHGVEALLLEHKDDPIDLIYVGGIVLRQGQLYRNLMYFEDRIPGGVTLEQVFNKNDSLSTNVFYQSNKKEYKFSELLSKRDSTNKDIPWYNTSSKYNGVMKANDMDWSVLKALMEYVFGLDSYQNYNSTIERTDESGNVETTYYKIACIIDSNKINDGNSKARINDIKDLNMRKLIFLLTKVCDEEDTYDMYNFSMDKYTKSNPEKAYLLDPTSYRKATKDSELNGIYTGFLNYYTKEKDASGNPYTNSVGVKTAVVDYKGSIYKNWEESGLEVFKPILLDNNIALTNTSIAIGNEDINGQGGYFFTQVPNNNQMNSNTNTSTGAYYAPREINNQSRIRADDVYRYLIGLDITDLMSVPKADFVENANFNPLEKAIGSSGDGSVYVCYSPKKNADGTFDVEVKVTDKGASTFSKNGGSFKYVGVLSFVNAKGEVTEAARYNWDSSNNPAEMIMGAPVGEISCAGSGASEQIKLWARFKSNSNIFDQIVSGTGDGVSRFVFTVEKTFYDATGKNKGKKTAKTTMYFNSREIFNLE